MTAPLKSPVFISMLLVMIMLASALNSAFIYYSTYEDYRDLSGENMLVNAFQYQHEMHKTQEQLLRVIALPEDQQTQEDFRRWFDILWGRVHALGEGTVGAKLVAFGLPIDALKASINEMDEIVQSSSSLSRDQSEQLYPLLNALNVESQSYILAVQNAQNETLRQSRRNSFISLNTLVAMNILTFIFGILVIIILIVKHTQLSKLRHTLEERVIERTSVLKEKTNELEEEIKHRIAAQDHMRHIQREAEQANRAKTHFLANMSHELRTPLNAILGFSEVMYREMFGPVENAKYKDYLHNIHESGRHLDSLLKNVLDLSKIDANEIDARPENCSLVNVAENTVMLLKAQAGQKGHRITTQVAANLDVLFDPTHLQQIFVNFLSNAIKYTLAKGEINIEARMDETEQNLMIIVSDNGVGIEETALKEVLQPFYRATDSKTADVSGTGVGLAISAKLAELNGASIEIKSEVDKGTSACLIFPDNIVRQ